MILMLFSSPDVSSPAPLWSCPAPLWGLVQPESCCPPAASAGPPAQRAAWNTKTKKYISLFLLFGPTLHNRKCLYEPAWVLTSMQIVWFAPFITSWAMLLNFSLRWLFPLASIIVTLFLLSWQDFDNSMLTSGSKCWFRLLPTLNCYCCHITQGELW